MEKHLSLNSEVVVLSPKNNGFILSDTLVGLFIASLLVVLVTSLVQTTYNTQIQLEAQSETLEETYRHTLETIPIVISTCEEELDSSLMNP